MTNMEAFELLRNTIANETPQNDNEAKQQALLLVGLALLENFMLDTNRVASALEAIELNTRRPRVGDG